MMLLPGLAAAVAVSLVSSVLLNVPTVASARPAAGEARNCGVRLSFGRLLTRIVPAPAPATLLTTVLTLVDAALATLFMAARGAAETAAVGRAWKISFAPPRTVTRSPSPKVPPRDR